ncbi:EF-Hand 1, calcium-binding site [Phytophthora cactorum]|nr:EF-Hand 1, calcium-binding site [Phytophthora cactorum]
MADENPEDATKRRRRGSQNSELGLVLREILRKRKLGEQYNAKEESDVCGNVHNMEKLFYLLDENDNGSIDRKEFNERLVNHLDDMIRDVGRIAPTQEQITTLISAMDTTRDNQRKTMKIQQLISLR